MSFALNKMPSYFEKNSLPLQKMSFHLHFFHSKMKFLDEHLSGLRPYIIFRALSKTNLSTEYGTEIIRISSVTCTI